MPGSNFIGGFKETGLASSPCRLCLVKREDMQNVHLETDCTLREIDSYKRQVDELMDTDLTAGERAELSIQSGINRPCCLSALPYFDATKAFPHDLMHLMHEGILNLECRFVLEKLLESNHVNIDTLNYKISRLRNHRDFTVPPPILLTKIREKKKQTIVFSIRNGLPCLSSTISSL